MRYSITLLMVCLSIMMMAIWMKRSVMQPLGWHCEGRRGVVRCNAVAACPEGLFGQGGHWRRTLSFPEPCWAAGKGRVGVVARGQRASRQFPHLLQPPLASNAHVVPWVAVDPERGSNDSDVC